MTPLVRLPRAVETGLVVSFLLSVYLAPGRLPGFPVSLHGLLLLPLCAVALAAHPDRLFSRRTLPYWALAGVTLLSAAVAGYYGRDTFRPLLFGLAAALAIYALARPADLRVLLLLLVPILVVDSLIGTAQHLTGASATGMFGDFSVVRRPLHRGIFFVMGMLAVGAVFLRTRRAWLLLPFSVLVLASVLTALRGVWLAGAAGLLALMLFDRRPRVIALVACASLAFLGAEWRLVQRADRTPTSPVPVAPPRPDRATTTPAPVEPSLPSDPTSDAPSRPGVTPPADARTSGAHARDFKAKLGWAKFAEELTQEGRAGYWLAGLRMTRERPLLGVGPGNFSNLSRHYRSTPSRDDERRSDPHSVYVGTLAELGLAGAACLALILWGAFLPVWRLRSTLAANPALAATAAAAVALCAAGLTWDLHVHRVWWIALALLMIASEAPRAASA